MLYAFEDLVREEMPNIPVIYVNELGFEEAMKSLLADANYSGTQFNELVPFFAYNRTVMINSEDRHLGNRAKGKTGCVGLSDGQIANYSMTMGEFDIQFIYASNNIQLSEQFEVVYNSDEGITGSKELTVDLEELGEFKYFLEYQDLQDLNINFEDTYYKLIIGSVKVRGFYFTFRSTSGIIKEINQRIISSRNLSINGDDEILGECPIT